MAAKNKYQMTAGTKLFYGDLNTDPATRLAGIRKFGELPEQQTKEVDITEVDQMTDDDEVNWFEQFAPARIDPGKVQLTLGFDEDRIDTVFGMIRQEKAFKVLFKGGQSLTFDGWIMSTKPVADENGDILLEVNIRVSGEVEFNKAT